MAKIASSKTAFDTSVAQLVALSEAGVHGRVLAAMVSAGAGEGPKDAEDAAAVTYRVGATRAPNARTNFDGTPCATSGIFADAEDGTLSAVDPTTEQIRTGNGILSVLSYGLIPVNTTAYLQGTKANLRVTDPEQAFWFCFEESETGLSYQTTGAVNPSEFQACEYERQRETGRNAISSLASSTCGWAASPVRVRSSSWTSTTSGSATAFMR